MSSFFDRLPSSYGNPIDPAHAHVTLVEPQEMAVTIWTGRDMSALNRAVSKISSHLGTMPLSSVVLHPDGDSVDKNKRHIGIPIERTSFLEGLREFVAGVVLDELSVKLPPIDRFTPHMSVTRIRRGRTNIRANHPPLPPRLHVTGYRTGQNVLEQNPSRARSRQQYTNKPSTQR